MNIYQQERRIRAVSGSENTIENPTTEGEIRPGQKWYIGGGENQPAALRDANVTRARCLASDMLGEELTLLNIEI